MEDKKSSSFDVSLFSLQNELRDLIHRRCQEVVWYADSRFRQALLKIKMVKDSQRKLMQIDLQQELELVLGIIGKCTATGVNLDIPIILRSLTDSLAYIDHTDLPLKFGTNLLKALDVRVTSDKPYALDTKYDLDWWNRSHSRKHQQHLTRDNFWALTLNRRERREGLGISATSHSATADNNILSGHSSVLEGRQIIATAAEAAMVWSSESDSDDLEVTAAEAALARAKYEDTTTNIKRDIDAVNVAPPGHKHRHSSAPDAIADIPQRPPNSNTDQNTVGRGAKDPPEVTAAHDPLPRQLDDTLNADIRAGDSEVWATASDAARAGGSDSDSDQSMDATSLAPPITAWTAEEAALAVGSDSTDEEITASDAAAAWASESD